MFMLVVVVVRREARSHTGTGCPRRRRQRVFGGLLVLGGMGYMVLLENL